MIEANSEQSVGYCPPSQQVCLSSTSLKEKVSCMLSSCRICLSSMADPATLTCGHKFCESCLDTYWHLKNKLDFIICPLCRARASEISFVKREDSSSTDEFRKAFSHCDECLDLNHSSSLCYKVSMIPIIYFIVKWLKDPVMELLNYLQAKMAYEV